MAGRTVSPLNQRLQGIGMTSARTRDRLVERLRRNGIRDPRVLEAIRKVPRHIFVDEALASRAYEDSALPIGLGQTISQPGIVALMSQALVEGHAPPRRVLEVGTGCGYQTAVVAQLVDEVFSVERIRRLIERAHNHLVTLRSSNVRLKHGDGMAGWADRAPFDGILVTAAPERVPEKLLEQLAVGGRLVLPLGKSGKQELVRIWRKPNRFEQESLGQVSFVPMLGGLS